MRQSAEDKGKWLQKLVMVGKRISQIFNCYRVFPILVFDLAELDELD